MTLAHAEMLVQALREQGFACQTRSVGYRLWAGPRTEEYEIVVTGLVLRADVGS